MKILMIEKIILKKNDNSKGFGRGSKKTKGIVHSIFDCCSALQIYSISFLQFLDVSHFPL